jgi:thymidine kinase
MIPITFYNGPMRSGKSTLLISALQRNSYRKNIKTIFYRPKKDSRDFILRSVAIDLKHIEIQSLSDPKEILKTDGDVIGIDELHFISEEIVPYLLELYMKGKEIYVAGLNLDAYGEPWPSVRALLCCPEVNIITCFASCQRCGSRWATRTYGKYGNAGPIGEDAYESICFKCWQDHFNKQGRLI